MHIEGCSTTVIHLGLPLVKLRRILHRFGHREHIPFVVELSHKGDAAGWRSLAREAIGNDNTGMASQVRQGEIVRSV